VDEARPHPGKQAIRRRIWKALAESGAARFPFPPEGRIPNFEGAEGAVEHLCRSPLWTRARILKCNPDAPQRPVRARALAEGKVLYMAVPRLRAERCFWRLDPTRIPAEKFPEAATIRGAARWGEAVRPEAVEPIDLVLCGSVAVNRAGERVGKGGGYSELEWAILRELGRLGPQTPIVTTVHPLQVIESEIPMDEHDLPLDLAATPEGLLSFPAHRPKPPGLLWPLLTSSQIAQIPALRRLQRG
jgi:5-formyltetrahydrofolate cyclo-ligase